MTVVWVNGSFDILHHGHFKLLEHARSLGDFLFVGLDSDARIRQKKGFGRPVHKLNERTFNMQSIKFVDKVFTFHTDTELSDLLELIKPDVMTIGSDYKDQNIIGKEFCKKIEYFPRILLSSTDILNWYNH